MRNCHYSEFQKNHILYFCSYLSIDSSNSSPTPTIAFTKELSSLRNNYAVLLDEHGQLKAQFRSLQAEMADLSTDYESRTAETEKVKVEAKKLKDRLLMMDRSHRRLEKELSFMRDMLVRLPDRNIVVKKQ